MLPYEIFKLLHLLGMTLLFMSLGALAFHGANGGDKQSNHVRGLVMATHGFALLLLLGAGLGQLHTTYGLANGLPGFIHPKLLIWVLLGAAPALLNKKPEWGKAMWFVLPLLMLGAAYFGVHHEAPSAADDSPETPAQTPAEE